MDNTENSDLRVAQVETLNFEALRDGDNIEATRLFDACCKDGFFYLDMSGTESNIQTAINDMYELEQQLFDLPERELMQYDIDKLSPKKLNGKVQAVWSKSWRTCRQKRGFQSYAVPKDGIMRLGSQANFRCPLVIDLYTSSLQTFSQAVSKAASTIFSVLSSRLQLQPEEAFQNIHNTHLPSPDLVRLLKYHAQLPSERRSSHIAHTDPGSLTFLFTKQYGLQILGAESGEWEWMQPRTGYATVNIGDCLNLPTNNMFRSCRHRVVALPGQAMKERYSFAYFMRPDEDALMKAVRSPLIPKADKMEVEAETTDITSGEWLQRKYAMLRRDTWNEEKNWILTGARMSKL